MRALVLLAALLVAGPSLAQDVPQGWLYEWPDTDFSQMAVPPSEIISGGPPKDGIPSIDDPQFLPLAEATDLTPQDPVIGFAVNGEARAYPLRILTWHEIVNDTVAGRPVAVTYCPLCNAAIVFDRTLPDGRVTEFGTTGKLRKSDLVMYDRVTESWWQQFSGAAIVGELTGAKLEMLPARLESFASFAARHPEGEVLVPNNPRLRNYGRNPYVGYDTARRPFLFGGDLPEDIAPMAYVVAVEGQAWALEALRREGRIETEDGLLLSWTAGKASALDSSRIAEGRDIGNVVVQRRGADSELEDVVYDLTFAFVFHAFRPEGEIRQ